MFDFSKYLATAQSILNALNLLTQVTQQLHVATLANTEAVQAQTVTQPKAE